MKPISAAAHSVAAASVATTGGASAADTFFDRFINKQCRIDGDYLIGLGHHRARKQGQHHDQPKRDE